MSMQVEDPSYGLSPEMKRKLITALGEVKTSIDKLLNEVNEDSACILCDFEEANKAFTEIHTAAATYYLRTFLMPFTDNYLAITLAAQHLSERKHGALIVIQRNDPIDALIHSGIPVGASLTHSLIESIFYPGGPLHDGAVLVQSNRIISASNVLPVSMTSTQDSKLGTRHRAAIGLSELSDALVIVVSEETGRASFALDGKLYPFSAEQFVP